MILISYITPYIIVHSDRLVSGNMTIKNKKNQTIWSSRFSDKEYLNIKVQPYWPKNIWVIVAVKGSETKKVISI